MPERLLLAARRIVLRRGFAGLTLKAIEAEVGASRSLVHYHYGGKTGLVLALVDSLFEGLEMAPEGVGSRTGDLSGRLSAQVAVGRDVSSDRTTMRLFIELLPHILRNKQLRERLATEFVSTRRWLATFLASLDGDLSEDAVWELAHLMLAMTEGLNLHYLVDPSIDLSRVYARWHDLMITYLEANFPSSAKAEQKRAT